MALFKIFKGLSSDLLSNKTNAVEGYVYYTTDESKFYIDIATTATAVIGENRMPLNAYKADTLYDNNARYIAYPNQEHYYWGPDTDNPGQTKVVNSPTGYLKIGIPMSASQSIMITFTVDIFLLASKNSKNTSKISYTISGLYRQSGNWDTNYGLTAYSSGAFNYKNLPVYFTGQDNNYVYIYIGNSTTAWSYINVIVRDILYSYWSSTVGYNYGITKNWIITNANILPDDAILAHEVNSEITASSATVGNTNIPVYLSAGTIIAGSTYAGGTLVNLNGSDMGTTAVNIYAATSSGTSGLFLISNGANNAPAWVSNITVPGTLNVTGLTTLNNDVIIGGLITTNKLVIQGQGFAQTPTAALHIATKGYVDDVVLQGFAANDAMLFKGIVNSTSAFTTILNQDYSAGWTYRADGSFFLSGDNRIYYVEPGDLIIAIKDKGSNGSVNDWTVVEHNIDGALYKSTSFTGNKILMSVNTSGSVKEGAITTTAVVTGINTAASISTTTTSIPNVSANTTVVASKITSNNVTVVNSISLNDSTSTSIGAVENGILKLISNVITLVGTVTSNTTQVNHITENKNVTATNTVLGTAITAIKSVSLTNETLTTATVVASIS